MKPEYLFVYGTLLRGANNSLHPLLSRHSSFFGHGTYQGLMYWIDDYPGVIPSANPHHVITGEIYQLHKSKIILPQLDDYEGCAEGLFNRKKETIKTVAGDKVKAWIYLYNGELEGKEIITSGDFLKSIVN